MLIQIAFEKQGRADDVLKAESSGKTWSVTFTESTLKKRSKVRFTSIMSTSRFENYISNLFNTLAQDSDPFDLLHFTIDMIPSFCISGTSLKEPEVRFQLQSILFQFTECTEIQPDRRKILFMTKKEMSAEETISNQDL